MFDLCVKGTSDLALAHRLLNPPSMQSWTQEHRKKSGLLTLLSEQKQCVTSERGSLKTLCYGWFEHSISFCSKELSVPFKQHAAWLGHTSMSCPNKCVCWHIWTLMAHLWVSVCFLLSSEPEYVHHYWSTRNQQQQTTKTKATQPISPLYCAWQLTTSVVSSANAEIYVSCLEYKWQSHSISLGFLLIAQRYLVSRLETTQTLRLMVFH